MWKQINSIDDINELKENDRLLESPVSDKENNVVKYPKNVPDQEIQVNPEDSKAYLIDTIIPDPHFTRNDPNFNVYILKEMLHTQGKGVRKIPTDFLNGHWWKEV